MALIQVRIPERSSPHQSPPAILNRSTVIPTQKTCINNAVESDLNVSALVPLKDTRTQIEQVPLNPSILYKHNACTQEAVNLPNNSITGRNQNEPEESESEQTVTPESVVTACNLPVVHMSVATDTNVAENGGLERSRLNASVCVTDRTRGSMNGVKSNDHLSSPKRPRRLTHTPPPRKRKQIPVVTIEEDEDEIQHIKSPKPLCLKSGPRRPRGHSDAKMITTTKRAVSHGGMDKSNFPAAYSTTREAIQKLLLEKGASHRLFEQSNTGVLSSGLYTTTSSKPTISQTTEVNKKCDNGSTRVDTDKNNADMNIGAKKNDSCARADEVQAVPFKQGFRQKSRDIVARISYHLKFGSFDNEVIKRRQFLSTPRRPTPLSRHISASSLEDNVKPNHAVIRFSCKDEYYETYASDDYDRKPDCTPWLISSKDMQFVSRELNEYKSNEMNVHNDSKSNTRFHNVAEFDYDDE
eukprot:CFRG3355T1